MTTARIANREAPGPVPSEDTPVPDAPLLEVRALTVRYGRRPALEGITFDVGWGERVAVVGPNGAGKSTLFKAVAGIVEPDAGRIVVHGHAPGQDVCVAYVQQRSQVDWSFPLRVADVVMLGRAGRIGLLRRPGPDDRRATAAALEAVGLAELADRQIGELSGGQQQRMFIARALAQDAHLVLMDEPLAGLDAPSRLELLAVIEDLDARGYSVMVATHDLELAAEHFEQVLLLNRRLIADGPPSAVLTEPNLRAAYRGTLRLVDTADGQLVVGDTCCQGEDPHHHR